MLNFGESVARNTIGCDEGKIKVHEDFCKVWELITANKLKASQFERDGGSFISNIIEL